MSTDNALMSVLLTLSKFYTTAFNFEFQCSVDQTFEPWHTHILIIAMLLISSNCSSIKWSPPCENGVSHRCISSLQSKQNYLKLTVKIISICSYIFPVVFFTFTLIVWGIKIGSDEIRSEFMIKITHVGLVNGFLCYLFPFSIWPQGLRHLLEVFLIFQILLSLFMELLL